MKFFLSFCIFCNFIYFISSKKLNQFIECMKSLYPIRFFDIYLLRMKFDNKLLENMKSLSGCAISTKKAKSREKEADFSFLLDCKASADFAASGLFLRTSRNPLYNKGTNENTVCELKY